jgi:hypothetical protein
MEKCYEYLGCNKTDCVMFETADRNCWEVEGTLCHQPAVETLRKAKCGNKAVACALCIYYKAANQVKK